MTVEIPVKIKVIGMPEAKSALTSLAKVAAEIFAVSKMIGFAKAGIAEWSRLQTASNELTAALGHQSVALEKLAQTSRRHSTFRDEEITQGYKRLAMYGLTEKQIERISPTMLNLATVTGSTETAARLLGLAIERGTGRLSMYGIHVDKTMSVNARLNDVLKQSENAFGGQSKAAFDAMNPLDKMNRLIEESSAGIGDALVPDLNTVADALPEFREALEGVTKIGLTIFKTAVFAVDVAVAGLVDTVAVMANAILALPRLIPGVKKFTDPAIHFFNTLAQAANENVKNTIDSTARMWDENAKIQSDASQKIARLKIKADGEAEKAADAARKKELAAQKKFAEDKKTLIEKLEHDAAQIGLTENEKKMADLSIQYEKDKEMLAGNKEAMLNLERVFAEQLSGIQDEENKRLEDGKKKEQKIDEKALVEKQKASDKYNLIAESKEDKRYKSEMARRKKTYDEDKKLLEKNGYETVDLTEQFESDKKALKQRALSEGLSSVVDNLGKIASKHKEFMGAYKTVAIAQATIDTYKSAESAYAGFSTIMPPFLGQSLAIAAAAAAIAAGIANVQQIASAKFAYGGVVTGGVPGRDSVPAMLMPGEIVYNPARPNPELAGMITNNTTNADTHNYHMGNIIINGNPDSRAIHQIGQVTEKALISAMRKAQVMGKITAQRLKIRG